MFMAYNQLIRADGIAGDVLEIVVHHGLSAIAIGALAERGRRFVAVDLFDELQDDNQSRSSAGNCAVFVQNMQRFFDDLGFLHVFAGHSAQLKPVLFQKQPAANDLNLAFASDFKRLHAQTSIHWGQRVSYFTSSLLPVFVFQLPPSIH
jgi:hypothetical protein